jgi:hypothetical protein
MSEGVQSDRVAVACPSRTALRNLFRSLLFRTLVALHGADLGYSTEGILVAYANFPVLSPVQHEVAGHFFDKVVARLRLLPGVIGAADAYGVPGGSTGLMAIS